MLVGAQGESASFGQRNDGKQKEGDMWVDELAMFWLMCWGLAWALLSGEGARLAVGRTMRGSRQ